MNKSEESSRDSWDNSKLTNIQVIGIPAEEGENRVGNLIEEIRTENVSGFLFL